MPLHGTAACEPVPSEHGRFRRGEAHRSRRACFINSWTPRPVLLHGAAERYYGLDEVGSRVLAAAPGARSDRADRRRPAGGVRGRRGDVRSDVERLLGELAAPALILTSNGPSAHERDRRPAQHRSAAPRRGAADRDDGGDGLSRPGWPSTSGRTTTSGSATRSSAPPSSRRTRRSRSASTATCGSPPTPASTGGPRSSGGCASADATSRATHPMSN